MNYVDISQKVRLVIDFPLLLRLFSRLNFFTSRTREVEESEKLNGCGSFCPTFWWFMLRLWDVRSLARQYGFFLCPALCTDLKGFLKMFQIINVLPVFFSWIYKRKRNKFVMTCMQMRKCKKHHKQLKLQTGTAVLPLKLSKMTNFPSHKHVQSIFHFWSLQLRSRAWGVDAESAFYMHNLNILANSMRLINTWSNHYGYASTTYESDENHIPQDKKKL